MRRRLSRTTTRFRFDSNTYWVAVVAGGGTESVRHALTMPMADFEDALQVAVAISGKANCIATRNVADYRGLRFPFSRLPLS